MSQMITCPIQIFVLIVQNEYVRKQHKYHKKINTVKKLTQKYLYNNTLETNCGNMFH